MSKDVLSSDTRDPTFLSDFFNPSDGQLCTKSFNSFLQEYEKHTKLFWFIVKLTSVVDRNRALAIKALAETEHDPEKKKTYLEDIDDPSTALKELQNHRHTVSQNLTNGIVNAFQRYFSSMIAEICTKRPEILASSKQIKISDIVRFARRLDLIEFIVDRHVNELSYGGLNELSGFFRDRLGMAMFESDEQEKLLRFFFEVRNINVHNGGIANTLFSSRVGEFDYFPYAEGSRIHLDLDRISILSTNAMNVARSVDAKISAKFKIRRKRRATWLAAEEDVKSSS